ncbi:glycoside hydrolase family 32 protein [Anaerocolumna sp. MB42-C2]|uniref:glycoside hydrolase family 32 protein n=1 Tax=Anaerocolumna sp. MB42-C2 TaxID=3070997 RepID=UPI0027E1CE17|nr:glycoside hydrolase family 32 protein [Anaerocolumna sp. MB42-C2]WMJ89024.1 glycoside hydrolase family 32 protein [Anaerocolumna sp. MB42-C2]
MNLKVTNQFLWMPVSVNSKQVKLHLYSEGKKLQEIDICLGNRECDFYASLEVSKWMGKEITVLSDGGEVFAASFIFKEEKPEYSYPYRPKLHFAPEIGWHNDPNGMLFADGFYHLYYQWNPYGVAWGNMHWGHAVSKDLMHWEHKPVALSPDQNGTIFSGSGIIDVFNNLNYGKNTQVYYYTAAGGTNEWSKKSDILFTQRMAYSTDGGNTLIKYEHFCMDHIIKENRDPKVFYHNKSAAYIMVLYLDGNDFAIFRSDDLIKWEETQILHFDGMWECPDLFELPVGNTSDTRWVFWSADGYYVVGTFDGYTFQAESGVLSAYGTKLSYAAQTYSGIEDRVISVAWLRMKNHRGNYCGLMSLPMELSLTKSEEGLRLKLNPMEEFRRLEGKYRPFVEEKITLEGNPVCIKLSWESSAEGDTKIQIGNSEICLNLKASQLIINTIEKDSESSIISLGSNKKQELKIILDQEVIEFLCNNGTIYGAVEVEENILGKSVKIIETGNSITKEWCELSIN